jgi:hypothetical protein
MGRKGAGGAAKRAEASHSAEMCRKVRRAVASFRELPHSSGLRDKFGTGWRRLAGMSNQLSVAQVLANLEAQMAFHKEQGTHHAQQESFHREQQAVHAAEYEKVARHYEAFKATAETAAEIAARTAVQEPPHREEAPPRGGKPARPRQLVAQLIAELPPGETFAPSRIAAEVNRRHGRQLRKPLDTRMASTILRRLLAEGEIRVVEKGTSHQEALYSRR